MSALRQLTISLLRVKQKNIFGILDLGSETVKFLIVKKEKNQIAAGKEKIIILKKLRADYEEFGVLDGRQFERDIIKKSITKLIQETNKAKNFKVKEIIVGLPANVFQAGTYHQEFIRKDMRKAIDKKERDEISDKMLKRTIKQAQIDFGKKMGLASDEINFLCQKILQIKIDGYSTPQLLGFNGRKIEIQFLIIAASKGYLEFIQKTIRDLGMKIIKIVHLSQGLPKLFPIKEKILLLDIGAKFTQIFWLKNNNLEKVSLIKRGAKDFSQALGSDLGILYNDARELSKRYQQGSLSQELTLRIREIFKEEAKHWFFLLENELNGNYFFKDIFLFGGGCSLPDIKEMFSQNCAIEPKELNKNNILTLEDETQTGDDNLYIPAIILAYA